MADPGHLPAACRHHHRHIRKAAPIVKPSEAVRLVGIVRALCPGQKLDDMTPDAWHVVLGEYSYDDCAAAVRVVYRERGNASELGYRRIEADDILAEVKALRARRIDAAGDALLPPSELADDPAAELAWRRRALAAAANGEPIPANGRGALKARNMQALTQHGRRSKIDA